MSMSRSVFTAENMAEKMTWRKTERDEKVDSFISIVQTKIANKKAVRWQNEYEEDTRVPIPFRRLGYISIGTVSAIHAGCGPFQESKRPQLARDSKLEGGSQGRQLRIRNL